MSNTSSAKSNTINQAWTIKGIDIETRIALQKAAKKEGVTLGNYCNTKLREAANNTLKISSKVAVSSQEIKDEITVQIDHLKQELQEMIKSSIEQVKPERQSFLQKIFG